MGVGRGVGVGIGVSVTPPAPPASPPGVAGISMVMATEVLADAPSPSVAVMVMVWLPAPRVREKDCPMPISPSMLDLQTRDSTVRTPSPTSSPQPTNGMQKSVVNVGPPAGLVMDALGKALAAGTMTDDSSSLVMVQVRS